MAGSTIPGFYTPMQWGAPAPAMDYNSQLFPTISQPGVTIPGDAGGGEGMWGSFQNWMNDSGVLGKTMADGTKTQGWGGLALGAASGIMNGWLGFQQLKLAKDAANQSRDQFNKNFAAQSQTLNTQLEDRQRARVASNPTAYQSVGDYMKQNRIGG